MKLIKNDLARLGENAKQAAIAAGEFIQTQINAHYDQSFKEGGNSLASQIVTAVDIKAQEIILSHLQPTIIQFDLGILAEESEDNQSRFVKDYFWCLDPMDGTLAFTEGRTGYAVSIALVSSSGDPQIGVVYLPDIKACYTSIKGEGIYLNNQPYRSSKTENTLAIFADKSFLDKPYYDSIIRQFDQLKSNSSPSLIQIHSNFGAVRNAIEVMNSSLACYFKYPKKGNGGGCIWDFAATRLFFEELDLPVSNFSGDLLSLNDSSIYMNNQGVIFATNESLVQSIMKLNYS